MKTTTWIIPSMLVPLALFHLAPAGARAAEGVTEINQTCAVTTGCVSGDAPGFPVTLDGTSTASFVLTSDLVVPLLTEGILLNASGLSIDLNGFRLVRSGCENALADCQLPFTGRDGIRAASGTSGATIRNGSAIGFAGNGIEAGDSAIIENVRVRWNTNVGLTAGEGSTLRAVVAYENGGFGVLAGSSSTTTSSAFTRNDLFGHDSFGGRVFGSTAYQNGGSGFRTELNGVTITASSAYDNGIASPSSSQYGFGDGPANVSFCASSLNDGAGYQISRDGRIAHSASYANQFDGFVARDSMITGSASRNDGRDGIRLDVGAPITFASGYRGNTVTNPGVNTIFGGSNLGTNSCNGAGACP